MNDLYRAKSALQNGGYTCVLQKGNTVYTSQTRGVKPLYRWMQNGTDVHGFSAADKVVGKATAFLYVLLEIQAVYAGVISESALAVLKRHGISVEYGSVVPHIINRKGDGICPFEQAVADVEDPHAAYTVICEKINATEKNGMKNPYFEHVKKNFGFGCMRLPMCGDEVDLEETKRMVDAFLDAGFNYFDTAHGYLGGKSEIALKECLTSRYPRDAYILTDKLSTHHFSKTEEIRPLLLSQLEICGVEYFDFYLMHAQDKTLFEKYKSCRAYETALELKEEGLIKHLGISFHDQAEVLDQILTEYPQVEVVQIQLNYVDYDDPAVQSRACLEVCRKHGKPAIIMEPVKGGSLVNLPEAAKRVFDALQGGSYASYAIRFAAGQEGVMMVLSGMGNMEMMQDNLSYMRDFKPLDAREMNAVAQVCAIFKKLGTIPCTACRYCTEVCPSGISTPDLFACMNAKKAFNNWNSDYYYGVIQEKSGRKASDCLRCGMCESICPQHLPIRELLADLAAEFEK